MITIAEIAEKCQVSKMTVSRALSEKHADKVSIDVRDRILTVAKELNYRRSKLADAFNTGRTHLIGFIGSPVRHFEGAVFSGVQSYLCPRGYETLFLHWSEDLKSGDRLLEGLVDRRAEGTMLFHNSAKSDYEYLVDLQKHGMPVVVIDRDVNVRGVSYVGPDNVMAATQGTRHLLELGHKDIYFVCRTEDAPFSSVKYRYSGYSRLMSEYGLEPKPMVVIPSEALFPNGHSQWFADFLRNSKATGIFANNDVTASYFLMAAHKYGFVIPRDFSVVGCGNLQVYIQALYPALTTVDLHAEEVGIKTSELLLDLVEEKYQDSKGSFNPRQVVLPTSLVVRKTTCPPK